MDLHPRHVVISRLSNRRNAEFFHDKREMAVDSDRKPKIYNSDQGARADSSYQRNTCYIDESRCSSSTSTDIIHSKVFRGRLLRARATVSRPSNE
jgi:hypothetical protein